MVNILRLNPDSNGMDKYFTRALEIFPKIGSFIYSIGEADSEYWNTVRTAFSRQNIVNYFLQVALMSFKSTAAMCSMVSSKEYNEVVIPKKDGLLDSYTYYTQQIL